MTACRRGVRVDGVQGLDDVGLGQGGLDWTWCATHETGWPYEDERCPRGAAEFTNGHDEAEDEPEPVALPSRAKFEPFDLTRFLDSKALWAANYFVLWPLGLALVATVETEGERRVVSLGVREWVFPEGEKAETINATNEENHADYGVFLTFARERLLAMKPDERALALQSLGRRNIAEPIQIILVEP